jgi:hypothetical protein
MERASLDEMFDFWFQEMHPGEDMPEGAKRRLMLSFAQDIYNRNPQIKTPVDFLVYMNTWT